MNRSLGTVLLFHLCNSPDSFKGSFMLRLFSCLLFFEGSFMGKRTADLWTLVETGIRYIAKWALLMDPFHSVLLFSGAS